MSHQWMCTKKFNKLLSAAKKISYNDISYEIYYKNTTWRYCD